MTHEPRFSDKTIYAQRIAALRETKRDHTARTVARFGYFDTDDHGYIPWGGEIPFEPVDGRLCQKAGASGVRVELDETGLSVSQQRVDSFD